MENKIDNVKEIKILIDDKKRKYIVIIIWKDGRNTDIECQSVREAKSLFRSMSKKLTEHKIEAETSSQSL